MKNEHLSLADYDNLLNGVAPPTHTPRKRRTHDIKKNQNRSDPRSAGTYKSSY